MQGTLQGFIFHSFVPGVGDLVQGHLMAFAAKARDLRGLGVAALLVTVRSPMSSIEAAFNEIREVRRHRPPGKRFLRYWTVLTLGPLLIGAGLVATPLVVSLPLLRDAVAMTGLSEMLLHWLPLLITWLACMLGYKAIPYPPVNWVHALAGGLCAALLFEIAKRLGASWLVYFPAQQAIYGAFASVPVFLLWVYLAWFSVLLGGQFKRCLEALPPHGDGPGPSAWRSSGGYRAWRVLVHLLAAQRTGQAIAREELLALQPDFGARELAEILRLLTAAHW